MVAALRAASALQASIGGLPHDFPNLQRAPNHTVVSWQQSISSVAGFVKRAAQPRSSGVSVVRAAVATGSPTKGGGSGITVSEKREPNARVELTVTVSQQMCSRIFEETIREYSKRVQVPGFQAGKRVPEEALVQHVGKDNLVTAALERLLKRTMGEALETVRDHALRDSEHIRESAKELLAAFSPISDFTYHLLVDVDPIIEWKTPQAYKGLKVTVETVSSEDVKALAEEGYSQKLKDLGVLRIASGRSVQKGDVVILDISAKRLDKEGNEGEPILDCKSKGFQLDTEDDRTVIPGFGNAIVGMELNDTRNFDLTFPGTWEREGLRGVKARFTAICKEIFVRDLPAESDEVAGKLMEGCRTIQEAKDKFLEISQMQADADKVRDTRAALLRAILEVVNIEVPKSYMEETGRQIYAARLFELQGRGMVSQEQLVQLASEQYVSQFLVSKREDIERTCKETLAVTNILKLENLKPDEEVYNREIEEQSKGFETMSSDFDQEKLKEQAAQFAEGVAVLKLLEEHAEITYVSKAKST